ncbi:hypothetical protein QTI33_31845 [Variovorax sp. J22P271]|uniref:hypothetical protein n=1 Tax=Variovorax davisae TaxID=3053515 RepID=UPI002574FF0B|nr:hypothetical protein [Variovorax sp. J22P271]MDM0036766.1 hypothetical protein [Variovorax sp. J22P271]
MSKSTHQGKAALARLFLCAAPCPGLALLIAGVWPAWILVPLFGIPCLVLYELVDRYGLR